MRRYGTIVLLCRRLEPGPDTALLLALAGKRIIARTGSVLVVAQYDGPLRHTFNLLNARVHVGTVSECLQLGTQVRVVVASGIAVACQVMEFAHLKLPHVWLVPESWSPGEEGIMELIHDVCPDQDPEDATELALEAMNICNKIVCVDEAQRELFPSHRSPSVIPLPQPNITAVKLSARAGGDDSSSGPFTLLHIGPLGPSSRALAAFEAYTAAAEDLKQKGVALELLVVAPPPSPLPGHADYFAEAVRAAEDAGGRVVVEPVPLPCSQGYDPLLVCPSHFFNDGDAVLCLAVGEAVPLAVVNATTAGLPVVTARSCGSVDSVLSDAVSGFIVDDSVAGAAAAAIVKLFDPSQPLGTAESRAAMGTSAAVRASNSLTTIAEFTENFGRVIRGLVPVHVLVSLEGCVAAIETGLRQVWAGRSLFDRKKWKIDAAVPKQHSAEIAAIISQPGFYQGLDIVPGAAEALTGMVAAGHNVFLVASPTPGGATLGPTGVQEIYEWVAEKLGPKWLGNLIITSDLTVLRGDVLITEQPNPKLSGCQVPSWTQLVFDARFNRTKTGTRLLRWKDWHSVLSSALSDDLYLSSGKAAVSPSNVPAAFQQRMRSLTASSEVYGLESRNGIPHWRTPADVRPSKGRSMTGINVLLPPRRSNTGGVAEMIERSRLSPLSAAGDNNSSSGDNNYTPRGSILRSHSPPLNLNTSAGTISIGDVQGLPDFSTDETRSYHESYRAWRQGSAVGIDQGATAMGLAHGPVDILISSEEDSPVTMAKANLAAATPGARLPQPAPQDRRLSNVSDSAKPAFSASAPMSDSPAARFTRVIDDDE